MSVQQDKFEEIADAIRGKTNSTDKIKPSEFASKVNDVYEAGKQAERIARWNSFLSSIGDGRFAFAGGGWNDETFDPPIGTVIRPTYATSMFSGASITDLAKICREGDITLDFSLSTSASQIFYATGNACLTSVGVINTTNATSVYQVFRGQSNLHTIEKLVLKSNGSQTFNAVFESCSSLVNLTIEGVIGKAGFDVSPCTKLSHDSLMSIINALKSGVSGLTVTLGATNLAKMNERYPEKIAEAQGKGWTVA